MSPEVEEYLAVKDLDDAVFALTELPDFRKVPEEMRLDVMRLLWKIEAYIDDADSAGIADAAIYSEGKE